MSSRTYRIDQYTYSANDNLLFDANIWLFLYGPQYSPTDRRVVAYSAAMKDILAAGSQIFIDVLVLSEFVNAVARFAYNTLPTKTKPGNFKAFRRSPDFKRVAKDIVVRCRRILGHCTRVESGFETLDTSTLLTEYEAGESDLNDQVLARLCESRGLTLVTDDADFGNRNVTVLTGNRRLLRP